MPGPDIFLSYARDDRGAARMFAEALADEGFSVWWDASLHSGETFDEVIEHNLREAKAVVVLWSPRSVASRWVRAEATQADRKNKLVPAMIEPCDRPVIFELTHTADLCDWTGDVDDIHWRTFMDDLRRLVGGSSDFEVPARARPAPRAKPVAQNSRPHPINRQPLRPGNSEVLFADGMRRAAPVERLMPEEPLAPAEVHCLDLEQGDLGDPTFVIASSSVKIGRTAPADIVLADKSVSREHCMIGLANDELFVTDLNSTNGTYVDDVRITRATILPVGSLLRIGEIGLRHTIKNGVPAEQRDTPRTLSGDFRGRIAAAS